MLPLPTRSGFGYLRITALDFVVTFIYRLLVVYFYTLIYITFTVLTAFWGYDERCYVYTRTRYDTHVATFACGSLRLRSSRLVTRLRLRARVGLPVTVRLPLRFYTRVVAVPAHVTFTRLVPVATHTGLTLLRLPTRLRFHVYTVTGCGYRATAVAVRCWVTTRLTPTCRLVVVTAHFAVLPVQFYCHYYRLRCRSPRGLPFVRCMGYAVTRVAFTFTFTVAFCARFTRLPGLHLCPARVICSLPFTVTFTFTFTRSA